MSPEATKVVKQRYITYEWTLKKQQKNMPVILLCHHVVDFGHPAAERFGLHVALHGLDGVVDDAAVFDLKIRLKDSIKNRIGQLETTTCFLLTKKH